MGSVNTRVVMKNSSRPTLRDQGQDQDREKIGLKRSRAVEDYKTALQCESKKSPCGFLTFFHKRMGIF